MRERPEAEGNPAAIFYLAFSGIPWYSVKKVRNSAYSRRSTAASAALFLCAESGFLRSILISRETQFPVK